MVKRLLKLVCTLLATISIFAVFGTVGSLENGFMDFGKSLIIILLALSAFYIFTKLTVYLDYGIKKEHHRLGSVSVQKNYNIIYKIPQGGAECQDLMFQNND